MKTILACILLTAAASWLLGAYTAETHAIHGER